jgi:sterol desaturase/sphingolipid hydroxylase (fatty acid hydroxylase superfamily)
MLFFFLGVVAAPVGGLLFLVASPNVAWLYVATAISYFLCYEWLHFAYHQPPQGLIGRLPFVAVLRRHHMRHHDPSLMSRWNFNITFPICDAVFGTIKRGTEPG